MNAVLNLDRNAGLGASDAAAACGVSPWKSPFQLWQEKLGIKSAANADEVDGEALHLEMGKALEPIAIARFEKKMGYTVSRRGERVVDPQWPTRWVTLDGASSDDGLVEAKSVGFADPNKWGDELEADAIPIEYFLQVQHAFGCGPWQHAWVPVIVLNRQFRIYRVQRDDEVIAMLTEKERAFWNYVETRTPPPPIDLEDAYRQWPQDSGKTILASAEMIAAVAKLKAAKEAVDAAEFIASGAKEQVCRLIVDNAIVVGADGKPIVTWKTAKPSRKVNVDKMRAAHPDIVKQFEFEQPGSRRLLVK